jgi:hypothetical protein
MAIGIICSRQLMLLWALRGVEVVTGMAFRDYHLRARPDGFHRLLNVGLILVFSLTILEYPLIKNGRLLYIMTELC